MMITYGSFTVGAQPQAPLATPSALYPHVLAEHSAIVYSWGASIPSLALTDYG
jgi:hypothetical protein